MNYNLISCVQWHSSWHWFAIFNSNALAKITVSLHHSSNQKHFTDTNKLLNNTIFLNTTRKFILKNIDNKILQYNKNSLKYCCYWRSHFRIAESLGKGERKLHNFPTVSLLLWQRPMFIHTFSPFVCLPDGALHILHVSAGTGCHGGTSFAVGSRLSRVGNSDNFLNHRCWVAYPEKWWILTIASFQSNMRRYELQNVKS